MKAKRQIAGRVYRVPYEFEGELRQVRQSLQIIREKWADASQQFRLWDVCPGDAAPHLTIEELSLSFLMRRYEKRYQKSHEGTPPSDLVQTTN